MFLNAKRYIAIQAMVEFTGNALLNGAFGWYWTQGLERVPLWGWASVAADLLGTGFGIGICLALIFTWRCHRRLRAGTTLPAEAYPGRLPGLVHRLPYNPWIRAGMMGLAGAGMAMILILLLQAMGNQDIDRADFIVLKIVFAAIVAAVAIMVTGYRALGDGVTPERPRGYRAG
jgi:hypothetical protein